jgi:hypothetical protein
MLVFGKAIGGFSGRSTPHISVTPVTGPFFSALLYRCKLNVDWDGAPTAYGKDRPDTASHQFPLQKNLKPWERPANNGSLQDARADSDGHWVGVFSATEKKARKILVDNHQGFSQLKPNEQHAIFEQFLDTRSDLRDVNGEFPVVQLAEMGGVEPGYYVSQCNATTGVTNDAWDQRRYVDASTVPYAALPNLPHVRLGDFGLIIRNSTGDSIGFFFGDTGAGSHLGECSGAVKLEIASERNAEDEDFSFIVFPGSGTGTLSQAPAMTGGAIMRQISKLSHSGNQLADFLAPEGPMRKYLMRQALALWGGPAAEMPMAI